LTPGAIGCSAVVVVVVVESVVGRVIVGSEAVVAMPVVVCPGRVAPYATMAASTPMARQAARSAMTRPQRFK